VAQAARPKGELVDNLKPRLTGQHVAILKHAWGYASPAPGFRVHCLAELCDAEVIFLVEEGYLSGPRGVGLVGQGYGIFRLTDKAIEFLKAAKLKDVSSRFRPLLA
jgi:hypothetical protein